MALKRSHRKKQVASNWLEIFFHDWELPVENINFTSGRYELILQYLVSFQRSNILKQTCNFVKVYVTI